MLIATKNTQKKSLIRLTQGIDVITLFGAIYTTISITSVKISRKYADSDKNYTEKKVLKR